MNEEKMPKMDYSLGEWIDIWSEVYSKPKHRENTREIYADARRGMSVYEPEMESWILDEISPFRLQAILNGLAHTYAKSTVRHAYLLLKMTLETAHQQGVLQKDLTRSLFVPEAPVKEVLPMTIEEQNRFLSYMYVLDRQGEFILRIFLKTGLRSAELRYLKQGDWDKKNHILYVRQSKTNNGIRAVPVIPQVEKLLSLQFASEEDHSEIQDRYIFRNEKGEPFGRWHFRNLCDKVTRAANMRHTSPHMLRHTFATRMIEKEVDAKSLSMILGHSSVAFTLKTYVKPDTHHLYNEMLKVSEL